MKIQVRSLQFKKELPKHAPQTEKYIKQV